MARVLRRQFFSRENMAQMRAAVGADDFNSVSVGISNPLDRSGKFIVKTRPAAAGFEFCRRVIKRIIAAAADIGAGRKKIVILAAKGPLGGFADDNAFFLRRQLVVFF